jgi:hypothetical protein
MEKTFSIRTRTSSTSIFVLIFFCGGCVEIPVMSTMLAVLELGLTMLVGIFGFLTPRSA